MHYFTHHHFYQLFHEIYQKVDLEILKLQKMSQNGVWCGYQDSWNADNKTITYDGLLHSSTNMNDPGIGVDLQSGIKIALKNLFSIHLSTF